MVSFKVVRRDSYWRMNGVRGGDGYGDENGDLGEEILLLVDVKVERREKFVWLVFSSMFCFLL